MDEMASDIPVYASSSNDSQLDRVDGIDFQTGMRHIIAPAVFGMIVGIIFQEYITPEYNWPSPPQGAILSSIILSPLLYFILVRDKASRWFEYTLGLATPGLIFFVIWFSGWGAVKMMTNPDFRVDYGTITTGHMFRPEWDKPLVVISSNRSRAYYSVEVMQEMMMELGRVTREAILESGKKVVVLASNSLSHRHFTTESKIPEDMSKEHITSHAMHLWDMRMIDYMKSGQCQRLIDEMPEFTEQAIAETDGGAFTWLLSTLEVPDYPAILHGYGTIIGTGNAIVEWPVYQHKEE